MTNSCEFSARATCRQAALPAERLGELKDLLTRILQILDSAEIETEEEE